MDYLVPTALELPAISAVDPCTPSPHTTFGQKGSGEAGYLDAPVISCAKQHDNRRRRL
jgi:2-furoyl-CoA dehydrogenase large subunit